jgi:hypothetical protein
LAIVIVLLRGLTWTQQAAIVNRQRGRAATKRGSRKSVKIHRVTPVYQCEGSAPDIDLDVVFSATGPPSRKGRRSSVHICQRAV